MDKDAVAAAVRLLKFRSYSQQELWQKLIKQGYAEEPVQQAIDYVTERGYLNDAALCDMLVTRYTDSKKYSAKEIYIRLRRRGLPAALVNDRLTDQDAEAEYQAALQTAMKVLNSKGTQDTPKIIRRLASKGYKAATIRKVLDRLRDMVP